MYSTRYSCPILNRLKFSRQFFEKYSYIRQVGADLFHADRETDRQTCWC